MRLANVPWVWDYQMCPGNRTSQCALGMGQDNSPGNGTIECALGIGLSNVPWEWD